MLCFWLLNFQLYMKRRHFLSLSLALSLPLSVRAQAYPSKPQAQRNALVGDKVALAKFNYDEFGDGRTNLRYGYMQT